MPEKTWRSKRVANLKKIANKLGDHCADWVEQALEWAQRIANGESWEDICNKRDTANWYRMVVWKENLLRLVGGSCNSINFNPAFVGGESVYSFLSSIDCTVPLVVAYDD